ncbi:MAG: hypothetical protein WCJ31_01910 [Planctomycetia bacterium]
MKVTMVLVESIALAVWSVVGILPVYGEPISNTPAGLEAGDHARWMGISTVVGVEWMPHGTTLETILGPSPRSLKTGTLLDLLDHSCGGAATAFDTLWTGSATGGAVDLGRIGGVGAAVPSRNSSAAFLGTPAGGAEASVSKSSSVSGVSR